MDKVQDRKELYQKNRDIKIIKRKDNAPAELTEQIIFSDLNKYLKTQSLTGIIAALCILLPMGLVFLVSSLLTKDVFLLLGTAVAWVALMPIFLFIGLSKRKRMKAFMADMHDNGIVIDRDVCIEKFIIKRLEGSGKRTRKEVKYYYIRFKNYDTYKVLKSEYNDTQEGDAFCISMAEPGSPCVAYREKTWDLSRLSFDSDNKRIYIRTEL